MKGMTISRKLVALFAVACLTVVCLGLAACGGGSSSSAASSASASGSSGAASSSAASSSAASSSAATGTDKYVGQWTLAAVSSEGVVMAGDFGAKFDMSNKGMLDIQADGTGTVNLGDESAAFKWAESGDNAITITADNSTKWTGDSFDLTYEDGVLSLTFQQDGKEAVGFFTQDGTYAKAKDFNVADAKPITDPNQLIGTWKLVGMKMAGIAIYGEGDALDLSGGQVDQSVTYEEGGVFKSAASDGTWATTSEGTTVTSSDITGEHTRSVTMLDDGSILDDWSEVLNGTEWIAIYQKA